MLKNKSFKKFINLRVNILFYIEELIKIITTRVITLKCCVQKYQKEMFP